MKIRTPTTCPVVFSLDIFGDKWSLVILRDLFFAGKSHFREFLHSDEKIASNILSNRLESLVKEGLLTKEDDTSNKSAAIYRPTQKALDLLPMLISLLLWGARHNPNVDTSDPGLKEMLADPEAFREKIVARYSDKML